MDIKRAKAKLIDISQSTATKHPKILIGELCTVIKFLLDEIERIKSPPTTILGRPYELTDKKIPKLDPIQPLGPPSLPSQPYKSPPSFDPLQKHRKGNAGDAT